MPARGFDFEAFIALLAEEVANRVYARLASASCASAVKPRLLTVEQAAVYLGRTKEAVQHMIAGRKLTVVRDGRRVFLDVRALDTWIENNSEAPQQ